jgi:putative ABC transport system ATP-binding protein
MSVEPLNNELIKYENMGISFENKKVLLSFNLSVKKKQKIILRGKSGTGKTTLLKMLLGFTKFLGGTLYFQRGTIYGSWGRRDKKFVK